MSKHYLTRPTPCGGCGHAIVIVSVYGAATERGRHARGTLISTYIAHADGGGYIGERIDAACNLPQHLERARHHAPSAARH